MNADALRVKPPKRATLRWLRQLGACEDGWTDSFRAEWPRGAPVEPDSLLRGAELGLDICWLASHILSRPNWRAFLAGAAPAWMACGESCDCAFPVYQEAENRAADWKASCQAAAHALIAVLWPEEET